MKKAILTLGMAVAVSSSFAQVVNSTKIHISEGALVSFGSEVVNNGEISNNGKVHLRGDLKNNASLISKGSVVIDGQGAQTISGTEKVEFSKVEINNDVNLQTPIKVNEEAVFQKGIVSSYNNSGVEFSADATHSGASDYSHVAAPVSKTGNGSFDFPVGDGASYRSFNASNLKGNTIEARYVANNPLDVNNTLDYNVEEISQTEYWVLKSSSDEAVNVNLKNGDGIAHIKNGVWVKDNNSLKGTKDGSIFTSGKSKDFVKEIGVWPNPTKGEFNLKLTGMRDTDKIMVDITNQDGRVIMKMNGSVKELRKAYTLPAGMVTTNLTVRVINGTEAMTQNLILNR